ncbi:unnamed protein product, partial [Rotaria sp. Silwood2]
ASDKLRKSALITVRHIEFCLASCNYGLDESAHIGKNLIPLLTSYTPYLQSLRLWRVDDFPWTSIEHVAVFQQDLSQLVNQLKEFVFLDIYGQIHRDKIEPYRSMVQMCFPNGRVHIEMTRFHLWI